MFYCIKLTHIYTIYTKHSKDYTSDTSNVRVLSPTISIDMIKIYCSL